jgi:hypothetical protein
VDPALFKGLEFIKEINISFNNLVSIDINLFKDLTNLELINLCHIQLESLPECIFQGKFKVLIQNKNKINK